MSDGGILFSVHCFVDCFGSPLFVLSFFDSVANIGDGSGMPGEPVISYKKVFSQCWEGVNGGIGIGCKSSKFVSFIIALVDVGVVPKFAFKIFYLCVDDSLFERAGVFEFFLEMAVDVVEGNSLEIVGPQFKEVRYAEQKVCL